MTDFYSVLRQTLIDRNLRSGAARQDAYTQARTAMIRRLWSFDPPLAEDEIDARIGQFDVAVDRIERDVVAAFAEADSRAAAAERSRRLAPPPPPPPPPPAPAVYDGYDEMADYAAAFGGQTSAADLAEDPDDDPFADAARQAGGYRTTTIEERSRLVEAALAERFDAAAPATARLPALPKPSRPAPLQARRVEPDDDRDAREALVDEDDYDAAPATGPDPYAGRFAEPEDDYDALPPARAPERVQRRPAPPPAPAFDDEPDYADEDGAIEEDEAPARPRWAKRRPIRFRNRERTLLVAVGALGFVFVATSLYVFLPLLFGSAPTAATTATSGPTATVTAAPADAVERVTLFNGTDPTVFEADSNNPIRFTGGGRSGFTTVSTSTSSSGARVLIGSGLSTRLAGEQVRVNIVARASREQGAVSLRFAYQSGLAISHWQSMSLTPEFETASFVWRVPKMRTNPAGDYILIEPGIPGDGTSADVQSVTIDVLRR